MRESFGGTVVTGIITALPSRTVLEIMLDQLACRLREQTAVEVSPAIHATCHPPLLPPRCCEAAWRPHK